MALPTKVVEQLSRSPARTPGWSSRVLLFSFTFFVLSLAVFLGIQFGYKPFLQNQVDRLDKQINDFTNQVPQVQQDELISFYSQLDNVRALLDHQTQVSKVFSWLEQNTNTNVQILTASLNVTNRSLTLSGQARSMTNLGEQLNRFQAQPELKDVQVSQLALDQKSGSWTFTATLTFVPQFFAPAAPVVEEAPQDSGPVASTTSPGVSASSSLQTLPNGSSTPPQ